MFMTLMAGALAATLMVADTDTTIAAAGATRLHLNTMGGEIVVNVWNRDQIRIQAAHSSRSSVAVERAGTVINVTSRGRPISGIVDYEITVPASMALDLTGLHAEIRVEGSRGEVKAESVEGNVTVRGGRGRVSLQAVNGDAILEGAEGDLEVKSVSGSVKVTSSSGKLHAETVSGDVYLTGINATQVNGSTVSGDVTYAGSIIGTGTYSFVTHSGDVHLDFPANVNATVSVATLSGRARATGTSITVPAMKAGRRNTFTLGTGGARIEAESFSGDIIIGPRSTRSN